MYFSNVFLFNSLPFLRREIVRIVTVSPNVLVKSQGNEVIPAQINPVFVQQGVISLFHYEVSSCAKIIHRISTTMLIQVVFIAELPPLAVKHFSLEQTDSMPPSTTIASVFSSVSVPKASFPE